ncbi:hypothetical protein BGZ65_003437, partial [Modicella reniformis]
MRMTPPRTPSPQPQASSSASDGFSPELIPASLPSPSSSLPSPVLASASLPASHSILEMYSSQSPSLSPISIVPVTISEPTASTSGYEGTTPATLGSNAGSLSILSSSSASSSSAFSLKLDIPSNQQYVPTLTTSLATPTSPSFPKLQLSPSVCSNGITSPMQSNATPLPASRMSSADLAHLLEGSKQQSASAGSRRPLILDLRPHPDFFPISIYNSININLPTLLVRRYRRGVAVSSFALESFITMPSDMDIYHQIQDSWRANAASSDEPHDVIVLDHDMKAGKEEYGRSATAAWTLLHVLERGGGDNCFGGAPIRV